MINLISETLRPKNFDELVLDEYYKNKLKKMHESRNVMNMIFYGKPGSGKTSAAKIFTESEDFDSLTINGSVIKLDELRTAHTSTFPELFG